MRALLAVVLLCPAVALADVPAVTSSPDTAAPPSSSLDTVRLFNTTESYHLEPSDVRVELRALPDTWYSPGAIEVRAEIGLTRHFQLDLAQDITDSPGHSLQPSATPIGLRYTLGSMEDQVVFNPAVEVTFTPQSNAPARAGVRLLLSEEVVPHLVVAANGYLEQNVVRDTPTGVDGSMGVTGGVSYALLGNHVHLGAEGQLGLVQDRDPEFNDLVIAAGPNAVLSAGPFAATLTSLFDLSQRRVSFEPMATLGCTF